MLKCIVLDLPQVVAGLPENGNLSFMGGNMFHSIPQTDAILLKVCKMKFQLNSMTFFRSTTCQHYCYT
jgi:hypothetical protein